MTARRVSLVAAAALASAACGPALVWHGKTPDRRHEVRVVEHHGQFVMVDGRRGPTFDGVAVGTLAFSPDGRHLAYAASRAGRWHMVVDGRVGPALDGVAEVMYSADGVHLAYAAALDGRWRVIEDGVAGPPFDAVLGESLRFSGDGARLGYVATDADGTHVVVDGAVGPGWSGVGKLTFSHDGRHVAYLARRGRAAIAVFDGVAGPAHDGISELAISPVGGRVAYLARQAGAWRAVVDGVPGPAWDLVMGLAFSSDGVHLAYVARRAQGDSFVVLDGVPGASYRGIRPATVAFAPGHAQPTFVARRGARFLVVHDGVEGPPFDDVRPPVHDGGGSRWGYVGRLGDWWFPVVDGRTSRVERWASDPVFSQDGRRVAYLARRGPSMIVVIDGATHRFDLVVDGTLQFDPTGRHWGCLIGTRAERRFHVVVDGVARAPLDVAEAIDATVRTRAAGGELRDNDRILRAWVAAEMARAAR